ncbi:sodium:proton antiporter NhaD [Telmatospirillum sp.]|uniref:sodium:proton antiporter NhaD n=1 Tax=Telmatospirillum sp. TaxID=2079197 RepID=UPI00284F8C97|nr:sodium:proton antiporter NhaD [Telmatospirillum sp.]MDR3437487.1 sodium:proton antiporter NhaD [Telmatospirillum sp.]
MVNALAVIFVVAYAAIAFEHPIKINKSASALVGAGLLWTVYAMSSADAPAVGAQLSESVMSVAQIVFFLTGAMTIVEVMDAHNGFEVITSRVRTSSLSALLCLVGIVTFFLSAILDNLTTTIVMISLTRRLLAKREDRLFFAGIIVIAANSGGAWSPIGDVTTTMLWIGGQITTLAIIKGVFLPSAVSLALPMGIAAYVLRGRDMRSGKAVEDDYGNPATAFERTVIFCLGLGILVAVPAFKTATHLPPFLGILFGLGILWLVTDLLHRGKESTARQRLTLGHALNRIDMSSIVFFIGILLAVATLEHAHILASLAQWLDHVIGRQDIIVLIIGVVSAIVDNVPLVAASMGMYDLATYPPDHFLWEFLAYCTGTGGSILVIGSAAGVAAMGLEKIRFLWYLKKIGGLALIGYLAGAATYLVEYRLFH